MKKIFCFLLLLLAGGSLLSPVAAQWYRPNFWAEIQAFKKKDAETPPPQGAILFVGSSSIRLWNTLQESFPGHTVVGRGFGGSTLADLKRYLPDIVYPYKPKQIVIYSGENDIASGKVDARGAFARFEEVFTAIRRRMPGVSIVYVSMKPSPSRERITSQFSEANALIKNYLAGQPNTQFVDVFTPMLDAEGKPREELFVEDMLHLNELGYQLWAEAIERVLISD